MSDILLAARSLLRSPLIATVATVTLGLGVGAVTTLFSVFDAVWLEPLPMRESERLAAVTLRNSHGQAFGMSYPNFVDVRARSRSFETLSGFNLAELNVIAGGRPELASAHQVPGDFFELMGLELELGRGLTLEDDSPSAEPAVVLSYAYWLSRFGGDPDIVGSTVVIEGASYRNVERTTATVVGVLRQRAWFRAAVNLWMPFYLDDSEMHDRAGTTIWLIGRLRAGSTLADARAELDTILDSLTREHPDENRGLSIELETAHAWLYGDEQHTVLLLLIAASLLLLIAGGNVTHLLLARVANRRREIALRAALGAGRLQIVRWLSGEAMLLALAGGALGLIIAGVGVRLAAVSLPRSLLVSLPLGAGSIALDMRVLVFAVIACSVALIASSLLPLWHATSVDVIQGLKSTTGRGGRTATNKFHPLIVSEVALSLVLLIGAGVTWRSATALDRAALGFDPTGVIDFWVPPSEERYPSEEARRNFYAEIRRSVATVPGIGVFGFTNRFPNQIWSSRHEFEVTATDDRPTADVRSVDAGYFHTMRIALQSGRHFNDTDSERSRAVAIVNQYLAARYWPDSDAIGRRLTLIVDGVPRELAIVGIVDDVFVPNRAEVHPIIYRPWQQAPPTWIDLVIRPESFSGALADSIRERIWSVDPNHFIDINMIGDGPPIWFARNRFAATLLGAFAAVAFALSAAGVFSVISFHVSRRRREMGIRKAVGASEHDLRRLVVGGALRQASIGIALGLTAAFVGARFWSELVYGVEPMDTLTTLAAVLAVATTVGLASWVPAKKLSRIHPSESLRSD